MVYIDTSVVVALLTVEPMTRAVVRWFATLPEPPLASDWLLTEFASALAIKTRTGHVSAAQARRVRGEFDMLCASAFRLAAVSRAAFANAATLVDEAVHGLSAGDALHLAVAKEAGATSIATLDKTMLGNLKRLGFAAAPIAL